MKIESTPYFITASEENICKGCGKNNGTSNKHSCPCNIINGDGDPEYCNCCNSCYNSCVDEANNSKD